MGLTLRARPDLVAVDNAHSWLAAYLPAWGRIWSVGMAERGEDVLADAIGKPDDAELHPPQDLTESEKYPPAVRLALIVGLPLALWALIGAGGVWLLGSLWGRVVGIVLLAAVAVAAVAVVGNGAAAARGGRRDRSR